MKFETLLYPKSKAQDLTLDPFSNIVFALFIFFLISHFLGVELYFFLKSLVNQERLLPLKLAKSLIERFLS